MVRSDQGYAMAVLLVALGIMSVMLTAAMPVWKQMAQREKEDELIFRGQQYTHAIAVFQRKYMNAYPPNVDVLVEQRFLRKKYKDPITNDDFQPLGAGQIVPGTLQDRVVNGPGQLSQPSTTRPSTTQSAPGAQTQSPGTQGRASTTSGRPTGSTMVTGAPGEAGGGGIVGVVSKSKDKSIRVYNGRTHYNEWAFVYQPQQQLPGGVAGSTVPGKPVTQPPTSTQRPGGGRNVPGATQNPIGVPGGIVPSIERPSQPPPQPPGRRRGPG